MITTLVLALALSPSPQGGVTNLELDGRQGLPLRTSDGQVVVEDAAAVSAARQLDLPGGVRVVLWTESTPGGSVERYRLRLGAGQELSRARDARPMVHLRRGSFDPLASAAPEAPDGLDGTGRLFLVQFVTRPIQAYRDALEAEGAVVRNYMPDSAHVVEMDPALADGLRALPFVRWVGPYRAADRLDEGLLAELAAGSFQPTRVHVQVTERGPAMKGRVAARVPGLGGRIDWIIDEGFRFDATVDAAGLRALARMDEVLWIDPWTPDEEDMDKVRIDGGANTLESLTGFTGQGVRAECMDGNVDDAHPDLQSNPILFHGSRSGSASHGTPVTGIVFGDGAANAGRRGLLPDGQPIFADYGNLTNRYTHTAELLAAPYLAVFQTNSWGGSRTRAYTSVSMEMDDILFQNDIVILQSQSNAGNQDSRPQAWAKNVVSVGGIRHYDTLTTADDAWAGGASTGPAADGRLKPDLCYWYDSILTTGDGGGSYQFSGTSAATPISAGHFGLFYQMWHEGLLGNTPGASVFESRPKATLVRAFMVNTAERYAFSGANVDLRRTTQGWGRPNVENLLDANGALFWVNEDVALADGQSVAYDLVVDPGTPEFAVTMVYLDRAGTTSASVHRINDLSLRVTAPDGTTSYWGNNGLAAGNASTPGGVSNERDVVENVFVPNPAPGTWRVEVFADAVIQDAHVETPGLDADFALVARGTSTTTGDPCLPARVYCEGDANSVHPGGADIFISGSNSIAANDLLFVAASLPPVTFGLVARSPLQASAPVGSGTICITNPIIRMEVVQADFLGQLLYPVDTSAAAPGGPVAVGETWNYQIWYRDGASSNFTDAVEVTWCD